MLVKALSRQNIDPGTVEAAEKAAQQALDSLWKERWINDSVTRRDERLLADLAGWAEDIRSRADLVIVVAGEEREAINGVLRAVPGSAGSPEAIVWDGSMSSGDYARLIEKIDARSTVMIAVSSGSEPLEQRAAYAIIKQAIFAAHHDEEGDKIYAVCPRGMGVIAMDAEENVYPMTEWPAGSGWMPANTAAVLLPLMIKGADCAAFLKGFYDTVGSPEWDAGAPVPAYVIAGALSGGLLLAEGDARTGAPFRRDCGRTDDRYAFRPRYLSGSWRGKRCGTPDTDRLRRRTSGHNDPAVRRVRPGWITGAPGEERGRQGVLRECRG